MSNKQKAIFSGNIISAYYFDQDYTTIEILYKIKDGVLWKIQAGSTQETFSGYLMFNPVLWPFFDDSEN